ncbi:MAG: efflux RND transporter permease subunit [Paludibacteraceae bacterium]|nr:efflux RND transporter permease subunit [Paludibacteraceae bacterium]
MAIYKTAIKNPVTTLLVFVAVMVIGIFSFVQLPVDQFPEMDPPYVMVMTTYPGASASEIETNVSKIMENNLTSVDNLKYINSTSKDNVSLVVLELEWGCDITEAVNDVRSFCDMAKNQLPDGCSSPMVFKFSSSTMPICQYAITADESYAALDKILNDEVIPQLNQINGIGNLSVAGAPDRYVYVDIDQQKLDAYGISLEQVGQVVSANNLNLSSGTVKMDKEQYQMQVRSEFVESSEIEDLMVTMTPFGQQVFIRDIATVRDTIKDLSLDERTNGREAVRLIVAKQSGSNTVQVCEDVQKALAKIQTQLPTDIKIQEIYNSADNIRNSINSLEESVLYALFFVVLVVLFFLGKWRATLIISLTIPISLIVAFIYLGMADSSINIISLCSLTIAIGMVVDDAIVVLENITRHIERGEHPREASIYATNEVWISVIATTLVLAAVFVPLTMMDGMAGIMFESLGWIVTVVCCTSTVIAITLTPMLCSKLLKAKKVCVKNGKLIDESDKKTWYDKTVVAFLDKVDRAYAKSLGWCLKHKAISIGALFVFFGLSILPFVFGKVGTDFMQQQDNARLSVTIELQRGTRIEQTLKTARQLEERFMVLVPEIQMIATSAGSNDDDGTGAIFSTTMNNTISMTVRLNKKWERERTIWEIAEVLRQEMATYPEIIEYQAAVSGGGPGGGNTVDVEIYGYDFDQTNKMAQQVIALTKELPGARDVYSDRDDDRPEIKIIVDKEKASRHGLTSATISSYLRNRVNGMAVGFLKEDGSEYDILVRLQEENRNSITDVMDFSIPTPTGSIVKLSEICSVDEYWAPPKIIRKSRQRIVTVKVTPYETTLGELAQAIEKNVLPKVDTPAGYSIRIAGDYEDQQETFGKMGMLGALIILLVYIVMASQFESFSKPAIIMFSVPFALSGVVLALWMTNTSLDMIGALGLVLLVGIVVKNGIVLVDYINLMRERGHDLDEAIQMSGQSRLRPVLMTAFTTILGMVPMAVSQGEGAEMWQPLGIVVIGGLTVSTFLTLYIVPIVYGIMSKKGERDKIKKVRENFIFMDIDVKDCAQEEQNKE